VRKAGSKFRFLSTKPGAQTQFPWRPLLARRFARRNLLCMRLPHPWRAHADYR
jgi:hypothetical protein